MIALDYSAGRPSGGAVRDSGAVAVIRYVGTPGRAKNLTATETADMLAHGVAVALVYEDRAGTALLGRARGEADARAALLDAHSCGVTVRCIYMAVDFDVANDDQMDRVSAYLAGAARVLGTDRLGVYGERDVVDIFVGGRVAAYGWQTKAWSGGAVSSQADLYQVGRQTTVDGVTCDVNEIKRQDFGQWPAPALVTQQHQEDDEMVIVTAPNRPAVAYYPVTGMFRTIGEGERTALEAVHQAAGHPAATKNLTGEQYSELMDFAGRAARSTQ